MRDRRSKDSKQAVAALLLAALVTSAAGCAEQPAAGLDVEAARLTPAEQEALVQRVALDPSHVALRALAFEIQGEASRKLRAMTPAARAATTAEALDILADARAPDASAQELAARLNALVTLSQADMAALDSRADALLATFPQLVAAGPALLGQVVEANPDLADLLAGTAGSGAEDGGDEIADCLDDCRDEYIAAHNQAIHEHALDVLDCSSSNPIAAILCLVAAMAEWTVKEIAATNAHDDCADACLGIPPEGECDADVDCAAAEWCDTGTLGIGDNECAPDKTIGQVCSRHAKCLSGCCRYDFFQHPVSMTCNPAADCN